VAASVIPRIPRQRRKSSKWPLLLQIIGFRIRLRLVIWRHAVGRKLQLGLILINLGLLWCKLKALGIARRMLNWLSPPRE
jgi:hypothetical protein